MRRLTAAAAILVVVSACGWLILQHVARARMDASIAQFRSQLGPDSRFTYATAKPAPLRLGADFTGARVARPGLVITASRVAFSHGPINGLDHARLRDVRVEANGAVVHADDVHVSALGSATAPTLRSGTMRADAIDMRLLATPGAAHIASLSIDVAPDGHGGFAQRDALQRIVVLDGGVIELAVADASGRGTARPAGLIRSQLAFHGLVVPPPSSLGRALGRLGYDGAHGTMQIAGEYDAGAETLRVDPWTLTLAGISRLTLSLGLDHLPPPHPAGGSPETPLVLGQLAQMRLAGLSLTYVDDGLAGRVIAQAARSAGTTPDQFRALARASLQAGIASEPAGPRSMLQQQAIRFLDHPRGFALTLRPPTPVPLLALVLLQQMPPEDAARSLGLRLSAD